MKFNKQQEVAIKEITTNLIKGNVLAWTLSGYAGTGKTTLASHIADIAKAVGLKVWFVAPTNKAAEVLRRKGNAGVSTVHRLLYKFHNKRWIKVIETAQGLREKEEDTKLIICDEASMLSDKLLDDLEEYAKFMGNKILYMGDPFQLPPVGHASRTVFDNEHKSVLTQVMRQKEESAILDWATALRERQFAFAPDESKGDVLIEDRVTLWKSYIADLNAGKDVTMVTWKNDARVKFNAGVRSYLGYHGKTLQEGEPIMAISNGIYMNNGETMNAPKGLEFLGKDNLYVTVAGKEKAVVVPAEFYRYDDDGCTKRIILVPEFMGASIAPQFLKGLYYWREEGGWKKEFTTTIGSGRRTRVTLDLSVSICTYGYAITAHKSQGSQWDEVYITGISKLTGQQITNARWLYTAVTRAASKVHMLDTECPRVFSWDKM